MTFAVGDIEPLYCTLALYYIDVKWDKQQHAFPNMNNSGRVSEIFPFEVGSSWQC